MRARRHWSAAGAEGTVEQGEPAATPRPVRTWFAWATRRARGNTATPFALVCTQVASRLRSGASVSQAWRAELGGRDEPADAWAEPEEVPVELAAMQDGSPGVTAAVVACRLSARSGAPLADVLDSCAGAIAEAEAAHQERERARSGPASTARLLGWLPIVGFGLGAALGADPVALAFEGGTGSMAVLVGLGCLLAGRVWVRLLVRGAQRRSGRVPMPRSGPR